MGKNHVPNHGLARRHLLRSLDECRLDPHKSFVQTYLQRYGKLGVPLQRPNAPAQARRNPDDRVPEVSGQTLGGAVPADGRGFGARRFPALTLEMSPQAT